MPAGRPSKYTPDYCAAAIECGKQGMGKLEICAELGIHHTTLEAWQAKHPDFSEAIKEALFLSQAWWEREGRKATFGGTEGFNATSYIFQMKNRFRSDWNDTQRVVGPGPDGEHKHKIEADAAFSEVARLLDFHVPEPARDTDSPDEVA